MIKQPVWRSNGEVYYNKFQAMVKNKDKLDKVHFDFYDDQFLDVDWSIKDHESLESIAYRRCSQLREKFSYIKLFYSGGHDSHTMLLSFIKSNTFIDEIVINIYTYWEKKNNSLNDEYTRNHPLNREQFRAAIPFVKKISNLLPKTKISIEYLSGKYLGSNDRFVNTIFQNSFDLTFDKMIHRNMLFGRTTNNVVNLVGGEKPMLTRLDGNYYWYCPDNHVLGVTGHESQTEMFYITPDLPELHRKQCHLMLSWIKNKYPDKHDIDFVNNLKNDNERQSLNDYIRMPLWHNESNLGLGKKVISHDDPMAGIADSEKFLHTIKHNQLKVIMDTVSDQYYELLQPNSYHFKPYNSYLHFIGK